MKRLLLIAAVALGLSLLGKFLADAFLMRAVPLLGTFVTLEPVLNPGVAFGVRLPAGVQEFVILFALILVIALARSSARTRVQSAGFGLIIGGAAANLFDRVPDGVVTDFFQVGTFPVFNVADSCITVGVCLLLWDAVRRR
ncbi:MAG: signal peptidase II [Candidatus Peribacteraceae bacterium]|nr:signal peptidase II [Candidatus Peribacteraceae bacterium]